MISRHSLLLLACLLAASTTLCAQQNPDGILPLHSTDQPYLFLVRDPLVHQELKLSPLQQRAVQTLNEALDADMWSMRNKPPASVVSTRQRLTSVTRQRLGKILQEEQAQRLGQIELWVLGLKSLIRQDVAQQLSLQPSQRTQIGEILTASHAEINDLQQQLQQGGDAAELNTRFREVQVEQQQQIVAVLEESQKQKWVAMLGNRIDVSKLGRIKFKAPKLQTSTGWVNSTPLTMEKLKGKVVALHFYAFA